MAAAPATIPLRSGSPAAWVAAGWRRSSHWVLPRRSGRPGFHDHPTRGRPVELERLQRGDRDGRLPGDAGGGLANRAAQAANHARRGRGGRPERGRGRHRRGRRPYGNRYPMGPDPWRDRRALGGDAHRHPSAGWCAAPASIPASQLSPAPRRLAAILSASSPEPDGKLGRMIQPPQLRIPGPTPVPDRVQRAMAAAMINHRGPEFKALLPELEAGLRWAFQTENDMLIFPASGTGGLESAVANLVSPGERVLAVTIGAFGDRFADLAEAFGAQVIRYAPPWGEAADPEDLDELLNREPDIATGLITHNETSTGVTNRLQALSEVVKRQQRLLVVDGVSSIGSIDLPVDRWGVDVAITASQKGWMLPPGVTMLSVSNAAWH